ncbi:hypothetical protein AWB78_06994 [Caballeronia calidae]|uniref:Uncharacterized protein n=1 Tax=Caballeronia calidae TaxID=1777139 RepID=A0A158ECK1_9BURK|nr:hypothetical protein [Caballeronia calidae]SAL04493.1 hypothetical protein AWB78_06994 [Caballeronia calidae]
MRRIKPSILIATTVVFVLFALILHKDPFSIVNQALFDRYSEGYVVCTMIRDATDPVPGGGRLGLGVYPDKPACYSQFDDSSIKTLERKDPYDYSDGNWNSGVARAFSGFMVKRNIRNFVEYAPGSKIRLPNGSVHTILDLSVNPLYINVRLDGPILTEAMFGPATYLPLQKIDAPFHGYGSQIGVPGFLFSNLYHAFKSRDLNLYRALNTTILAALLAVIVICVFVEFGLLPAVFLGAGMVVSPWFMGFAGNMYWMEWTWFLPFTYVCFVMSRSEAFAASAGWKTCLGYAGCIAIKAACGYEYMSTVMLASMIPLVYVGLRESASVRHMFFAICRLGISGVIAFFAILLVHAKLLGGTIANGLHGIHEDMARRTYSSGGDPALGTNAPLTEVLRKYFGELLQPILVGADVPFYVLLILLGVAAVMLAFSKDVKRRALSICFFLSIAAPMSWFVLAKGHSFVHYFLNPVLWDLPAVPLGLVCVGVCLAALIDRIRRKPVDAMPV